MKPSWERVNPRPGPEDRGHPAGAGLAEFEAELQGRGIRRVRPTSTFPPSGACRSARSPSPSRSTWRARNLTALARRAPGPRRGVRPDRHPALPAPRDGPRRQLRLSLYEEEEWVRLFGSITQPYVEEYRPEPFSRRFVRHLPGWYAQKHPDEDWAETFAVWMTPRLDWRAEYADWPEALAKLDYCDRTMQALRGPGAARHRRRTGRGRRRADLLARAVLQRCRRRKAGVPARAWTAPCGPSSRIASREGTAAQPASQLIRRLERDLMTNVYSLDRPLPRADAGPASAPGQRADQLGQVYPEAAKRRPRWR